MRLGPQTSRTFAPVHLATASVSSDLTFGQGLFRHGKMKTSVVKSNGRSGDIAAVEVSQAVRIPKLKILTTGIILIGDNPVIVHNWSKKAEKQLLDGMTGEPSAGKEPKDRLGRGLFRLVAPASLRSVMLR